MKILIQLNEVKDIELKITKELVGYLLLNNVEVYSNNYISSNIPEVKLIDEESIKTIDFSIILGGDGTVLEAAHHYEAYDFPYLGINLGRVGCLCEGTPENYKEVLDKVLKGNYKVENRVILSVDLIRNNQSVKKVYAFNEIVLTRGKRLKMLKLNIQVNDSNDTNFYADGIIVATPTGSSAYSLASGGPLLIPTSKSFVITPICAQLKTITSLVVDGEDKISISLKGSEYEEKPQLEIDGRESYDIEKDDIVLLCKAQKTLKIMKVNLNESLYEPIFKVTNTFK